MINEALQKRLELAIANDGRSLREISKAAGLGENYLNQLLKDGKTPRLDSLQKIARALNASFYWIVEGIEVSQEAEEIARKVLQLPPTEREAMMALVSRIVERQ